MSEAWEVPFAKIEAHMENQNALMSKIDKTVTSLVSKTVEQNGRIGTNEKNIGKVEKDVNSNRGLIYRLTGIYGAATAVAVAFVKIFQ